MSAVDLAGTTAVIAGAGRRGQAGEIVVRGFAERGARVCIVERDLAVAQERAGDIERSGADALAFACDLTDVRQADDLARRIAQVSPAGVHSFASMAGGFAMSGPVGESDPEVWHRMIAINLTTAYVATRALLPLIRRARGSIVYFAAAAALPGAKVAKMSAYTVAKTGLVTLMRAVAAEEMDAGVRANAIAPTAIRTQANLDSMGDRIEYVERQTVADWVVWLCSRDSGPVSGQVIRLG